VILVRLELAFRHQFGSLCGQMRQGWFGQQGCPLSLNLLVGEMPQIWPSLQQFLLNLSLVEYVSLKPMKAPRPVGKQVCTLPSSHSQLAQKEEDGVDSSLLRRVLKPEEGWEGQRVQKRGVAGIAQATSSY
tara:strand:- start:522 stop:914 length:393 start_codon:yes stop_codon:yes gene_type:complete